MKKFSTSVSPFLMLLIPVLLFVGLSLIFNQNVADSETSSSFSAKIAGNKMVNVGQQTLLKFLLKN